MTKNITSEIDRTTHAFMEAIAAFPEDKFNTVPFQGSWTAAQVADHIRKSISGIPDILAGPITAADRPTDEKIPTLKEIFLNFSTKLQAPDFVLPENTPITKDELLADLEDTTAQLMNASESMDLNALCTAFELPTLGNLTREEWITFGIFHTQRHTHQLNNIYNTIMGQ